MWRHAVQSLAVACGGSGSSLRYVTTQSTDERRLHPGQCHRNSGGATRGGRHSLAVSHVAPRYGGRRVRARRSHQAALCDTLPPRIPTSSGCIQVRVITLVVERHATGRTPSRFHVACHSTAAVASADVSSLRQCSTNQGRGLLFVSWHRTSHPPTQSWTDDRMTDDGVPDNWSRVCSCRQLQCPRISSLEVEKLQLQWSCRTLLLTWHILGLPIE